ncbi:FAD-dependent oxidoreductase [Thiolapillus sp.]
MRPDLLIFGGGIAGLWTLLRARQAGYQAVLLESRALGGVQSIASQGIIHGGTKYALKGQVTDSTRAIADMPGIWQAALAGEGPVDLSRVRLLSPHQHLWSTGSLTSSLAGLFASRLMRSRVAALKPGQRPPPFDDPAFQGRLYRLREPVLDTASLMGELERQLAAHCYHYAPEEMTIQGDEVHLGSLKLQPRRVLLAAGQGNADLLARWGRRSPAMQLRPLHMVMARGRLPAVHAHCLGASANPRLTITSYPLADGRSVWYLGGQLAEKGVGRDRQAQIDTARRELTALLPWMDFSGLEWATLRIDRAEVDNGGARPDDCYLERNERLMVAWPTKLALAPRLAEQVLRRLDRPTAEEDIRLPLPPAPLARLPWEDASWS